MHLDGSFKAILNIVKVPQLNVHSSSISVRFHSEQTKTVPSKVFQALQHSYPGVDGTQRMPPRSKISSNHKL